MENAKSYKEFLNEAEDQWTVKDIIELQKAHDKVGRATVSLNKAVVALNKLSHKNATKPNGSMFVDDVNDIIKHFDKGISVKSKFWKAWEEFKKGGEAAFPDNWNK